MAQRIYTIGTQDAKGNIDTATFIFSKKKAAEMMFEKLIEKNHYLRYIWLSWSEATEYGYYEEFNTIRDHAFAPLTDPKDIYWD